MNSRVRQCMFAVIGLALTAPVAQAQLGLNIGAGPVIPLGKSADQLSPGVHVQVAIPFTLWKPPYIGRIPHPDWPDALEFIRPRLSWRADFQYEQMAGPDRPVRVMAAEALATRSLPRKQSWFISPYMLLGVGAYNTQFYLPRPAGVPYAGTADARTNVGFGAGLGLTNQLAGYNISLESKFRYIRNALSDLNGTHIPMKALFIMARYTFSQSSPSPF